MDDLFTSWVTEVYQLRFEALEDSPAPSLPLPDETGAQAVLESLRGIRGRVDRVEVLLFQALRAQSRLREIARSSEDSLSDDWDRSAVSVKSSSVRRGDTYEGPRERYAESNLATMDSRIRVRECTVTLGRIDTVVAVIRQSLRGLNDLRQDHRAPSFLKRDL